MRGERLRLIGAVGLQLLILVLVPANQVLAGWRGQLVTLATAPVDPMDPFSGAYVRLSYEVERPVKGLPVPELVEGDTLYLVVEQAAPTWRLVALVTEPPAARPGRAALRATWHAGAPRLVSAGRFYLPTERAKAAEAVQAAQQAAWWKAFEKAQAEAKASGREAVPPPRPSAEVDLRVDDAGNVRVQALRLENQTFTD